MRCEVALDRMLEADPDELRGGAGTELSAHIAGCQRCAAAAAALRAELDTNDAAMAAFADPGPDAADAAADAALAARVRQADRAAGAAPGRAEDPRVPAGRPGRLRVEEVEPVPVPGPGSWIRRSWIPLAAAAALAAVLVVTGDDPFPVPDPGTQTETRVAPRVAVRPPADRGAAVMETENPNITIVWLYEREGS